MNNNKLKQTELDGKLIDFAEVGDLDKVMELINKGANISDIAIKKAEKNNHRHIYMYFSMKNADLYLKKIHMESCNSNIQVNS